MYFSGTVNFKYVILNFRHGFQTLSLEFSCPTVIIVAAAPVTALSITMAHLLRVTHIFFAFHYNAYYTQSGFSDQPPRKYLRALNQD